jgi:hypothetical protein
VARISAEAACHLHLNLRGKEKRKEGKRQGEGPQASQAVQEERMGATAFRPPPNLMRVGRSP